MTMSKVKIQRLRYMTPSFTPLSAATSVRVSDAPTVADAPRHCADVHACPLQVTRSRRYEQTLTSGDQEMFSGKNCVTTLGVSFFVLKRKKNTALLPLVVRHSVNGDYHSG